MRQGLSPSSLHLNSRENFPFFAIVRGYPRGYKLCTTTQCQLARPTASQLVGLPWLLCWHLVRLASPVQKSTAMLFHTIIHCAA